MTRALIAFATLLTLAAAPAHAQQQPDRPGASAARVGAGAVLGAAGGILVGGVVGAYVGGNQCSVEGNPDSCRLILGILVGMGVGSTIGAPTGAHLANRSRGNFLTSLAASTAIGVAGVYALRRIEDSRNGGDRDAALISTAIAIPVLQSVVATWLELRSLR